MIVGFNHTSFTVSNLDKAVQFWTSALGFDGSEIVERKGAWVEKVTGVPNARIRVAHIHGYGHHVEFIEYADGNRRNPVELPNNPGVGHICLDVEDIDETFRQLIAAGATPLGEMTTIHDPTMVACSAGYLRDPNGIIIELLEKA